MNEAWRPACRLALGVALAMIAILTLHYPHSFRAMLAVALIANLPTFRKRSMRQRLLLVWIAGAMGAAVEAVFLDAPWLYLPAYAMVIFLSMKLASRSRDAATMTLLVYGLSGSLISGPIANSAPIMGGFYRTLAVTIGIFAAAIAFYLIPLRKGFRPLLPEPINLKNRDTIFLGLVGVACLTGGHVCLTENRVFAIMGGIPWAIQLLTASPAMIRVRLVGALMGTASSLAILSILSASNNNAGVYITVISCVMGIIGYLGVRYPWIKPACAQFAVSFMIPTGMLSAPVQSFRQEFEIFEAMWLGILIASLMYWLHLFLLSVENRVQLSSRHA